MTKICQVIKNHQRFINLVPTILTQVSFSAKFNQLFDIFLRDKEKFAKSLTH